MPQYYNTHCLICGTSQIAPVENVICSVCADPDTDTVPEYIAKLKAQLEAAKRQTCELPRVSKVQAET